MQAAERWPTWPEKLATLRRLRMQMFPSQRAASSHLVGRRDLPAVVQVIGGERAGKSQWSALEITSLLPWCNLVYLVGAEYENTAPEFEYIERNLLALNALADVSKPKHGQWQLAAAPDVGGCEVTTLSLNRLGSDALIATGRAPDVIALCEAGLLEQDHFVAAYTRVAESRGAVIASGTLKRAKPWYVALFRQLQGANPYRGKSFSLPSWENASIYPGGRDDPVIQAMRQALGEVRFAERIGAEPVASPLLVFGREFDYNLHVQHVAYDPALPLLLACDPGYAGAYALLVVQTASASDVRVIDEFYAQYSTWDRAVEWLQQRPYIASTPHPAGGITIHNVSRAVMDIAGTQHHADKSQVEQWLDATGIRFESQPVGIETGISRLRDFLRSPGAWDVSRIRIDPKCEGLLWELAEGEMYPRDAEGNPIREAPLDASNHSRKALSYLLCRVYGESDNRIAVQPRPSPGDPFAVLDPARQPHVELVSTPRGARFERRTGRPAGNPLTFH